MKTVVAPLESLREFVRSYVVIEGPISDPSPVVATSEITLGFFLGDRGRVFDHRTGELADVPATMVAGPQTQRWVDLQPMARLACLFVRFEPGGFHRLFGVDVVELTDHGYAGTDVIGPEIETLRDAIAEAPTVRAKVCIVEAFLLTRASIARREGAVHRAGRVLTAHHGCFELTRLSEASGVSDRQFRGQFLRQHGMSPKHYAKVVRFSYALRLKDSCSWLSWAEVSQLAGHFDQMHLVKDCKLLGAAPPSGLIEILSATETANVHPLFDEPFTMPESVPSRLTALRRRA